MKKVLMIILRVVLLMMFILCLGAIFVLSSMTEGSWLAVVVAAFIVSVITGRMVWKVWRQLTCVDTMWVNWGINTLFFTVFLTALFYSVNYFPVEVGDGDYQAATVNRLYREQHYRSRRVGRRVYSRGTPYWVYKAELRLPDDAEFTVDIPLDRYNQLHKGDTVGLPLCRGVLGRRVIVTSEIRYPRHAKKQRRHRPGPKHARPSRRDINRGG